MDPIDDFISNFQEFVTQVPEIVRPLIVSLAGAIPFVEGEGGAIIGIVGGLNPVVAAVAAAIGNFLSVLIVVAVTSRARTAVMDRRLSAVGASGTSSSIDGGAFQDAAASKPESKGRLRFKRWVVRFGVPGASLLAPLAVPTQITAAILIGGGTPRRWVLLWQAIAIVMWTTIATVSVWAALTFVVGV